MDKTRIQKKITILIMKYIFIDLLMIFLEILFLQKMVNYYIIILLRRKTIGVKG